MNQVSEVLAKKGILDKCSPGEICVVVVPSERVRASVFATSLLDNGVSARLVGSGSCLVVDAAGNRFRVRGMVVLTVLSKDLTKIGRLARLFGITAVRVQSKKAA